MIWAHFLLFSPILFAVLTTFNLQCLSLEEKSHHKLCGVSGSFTAYRIEAFSCSSLGKRRKKNLLLKTYWVKKTRDEINTPYGPLDVRTSGCSISLQGRSEAELLQSLFSRHELAGLEVCRLFEEVDVMVLLRSLSVKQHPFPIFQSHGCIR